MCMRDLHCHNNYTSLGIENDIAYLHMRIINTPGLLTLAPNTKIQPYIYTHTVITQPTEYQTHISSFKYLQGKTSYREERKRCNQLVAMELRQYDHHTFSLFLLLSLPSPILSLLHQLQPSPDLSLSVLRHYPSVSPVPPHHPLHCLYSRNCVKV